jgi:hypothetical protein
MNRYRLKCILPVQNMIEARDEEDTECEPECPEIIVKGEEATSAFKPNPFLKFPPTIKYLIYAENYCRFLMGLLRGVEYLELNMRQEPQVRAFHVWIEETKHQMSLRISNQELPLVERFLRENLGSEGAGIPHRRIRLPYLIIFTEVTDIILDLRTSQALALFLMTKIVRTEAFIEPGTEKDHLKGFLLKHQQQDEAQDQQREPENPDEPEDENTDDFWGEDIPEQTTDMNPIAHQVAVEVSAPAKVEEPGPRQRQALDQPAPVAVLPRPPKPVSEIEEKKGAAKTEEIEEKGEEKVPAKAEEIQEAKSPSKAIPKLESKQAEPVRTIEETGMQGARSSPIQRQVEDSPNQQQPGLQESVLPENQQKQAKVP